MNKKNFKKVLDQIRKHPETWNQETWHCDTNHCFFGWAQMLSKGREDDEVIRAEGMEFLGLSRLEADYLAEADRVFEDFQKFYEGDLSRYVAWLETNHNFQTAFPYED